MASPFTNTYKVKKNLQNRKRSDFLLQSFAFLVTERSRIEKTKGFPLQSLTRNLITKILGSYFNYNVSSLNFSESLL